MDALTFLLAAVATGVAATATMDLWQIAAKALFGLPRSNWAMVGRWFAHLARGRVFHSAIAEAEPVDGELRIGWIAHYGVGMVYAAVYLALPALGVIEGPTFPSAIGFALFTILAGWLLLLPGMGAGFFASKTPNQALVMANGLSNHFMFGVGLYLGALAASPG